MQAIWGINRLSYTKSIFLFRSKTARLKIKKAKIFRSEGVLVLYTRFYLLKPERKPNNQILASFPILETHVFQFFNLLSKFFIRCIQTILCFTFLDQETHHKTTMATKTTIFRCFVSIILHLL